MFIIIYVKPYCKIFGLNFLYSSPAIACGQKMTLCDRGEYDFFVKYEGLFHK